VICGDLVKPYYPVLSFTFVIIGVLVVNGLAAHGGRLSAR
jgi:hypothetical protein